MAEPKCGKYLTWSEVEGYLQATLYDEDMTPIWVFSGLYKIELQDVNVKILLGVPEMVESATGGNLVAEKSEGVLTVRPEGGFYTQERPLRRILRRVQAIGRFPNVGGAT